LAGANGIGKSTFLATLNYGLTGAVPNPSRRFLSASAYLREAQDFTNDFFDGRISEDDRDVAAVSVEFEIGTRSYTITRGLFDRQELRRLLIVENGTSVVDDKLSNLQKDAVYRQSICADVGLSSFEQFVFVQHFLLTFDESRHLLFWDEDASAQMLFLCFGGDPEEAARADHLKREMSKAGSWGRNLQFQANNVNKSIAALETALNDDSSNTIPDIQDDAEEYVELTERLEAVVKASEEKAAHLQEAELRVMQASAAVASYRSKYNEAFNEFVNCGVGLQGHPELHTAIRESSCPICKAKHEEVSRRIKQKLDAGNCPLCDSPISLPTKDDSALQRVLAEIDAQLADAMSGLEEATKGRDRLQQELRSIRDSVASARSDQMQFEEHHQEILDAIRAKVAAKQGPVAKNLAALYEARTQLLAQRDEHYEKRDEYKDELKVLQRKLEQRYAIAEEEFVPLFRELAELFLGIDLDISLAVSQSTGMRLELEMRGDLRRQEHELSESQRFFVDIALRMALARYLSSAHSPASLFIDTPEGSLDIAYEDRAGEMFATFVENGHDLVMTANINSSKLLTTLARKCGPSRMKIIQMTGWTELSDVQQRASDLFQSAFSVITEALHNGEGTATNA
jgi:DNA repair exonuclease SbcCD ATPase subunit